MSGLSATTRPATATATAPAHARSRIGYRAAVRLWDARKAIKVCSRPRVAASSIAFLLGDGLAAQLEAFPTDAHAASTAVAAHHAWSLIGTLAAERAVSVPFQCRLTSPRREAASPGPASRARAASPTQSPQMNTPVPAITWSPSPVWRPQKEQTADFEGVPRRWRAAAAKLVTITGVSPLSITEIPHP